jgi:serine/threonine protein kinase
MHRGDRIAGRFDVIGEAGRGGMGTVFRAHDRKRRCDVALKVIAAEGLDSAPRFQREAEILAGVRHENIVEYVSHGETPDGLCYLVMEWVDGEDLRRRLERGGVTPAEAVTIARQVAAALVALHAAGVVHRDVKPSNLMLVDGRVKLVDLGVARIAGENVALTLTGTMIGTAGYMSPEQARGDKDVDARADLFALGCVLHECLTGVPAFAGATTYVTRAKVLLHDPPRVRQLAPGLPPPLEALVLQLLAKRPEDRPADAAVVERALAALDTLPTAVPVQVAPDADVTMTLPPRPGFAVLMAWTQTIPVLDDLALPLQTFTGGAMVVGVGEGEAARVALVIAARVPDARIVVTACDLDTAARALVELEVADHTGVWRLDADGTRVRLLAG